MTHEEKLQLKEEIARAVPKEIHELLGNTPEDNLGQGELDKVVEVKIFK
jgi:hypothetical protein